MKKWLYEKSMGGGMAMAFAAQAATLLTHIFTALVVARRLAVEPFAYWQLFVFYLTFAELTALGVAQGVYLRGGQARPALLKSQLLIVSAYTVSCALLVALGGAVLLPAGSRQQVVWAVASALLPINVSGFLGCLLQAQGHTRLYSASVLLGRVLFLCLSGIALWMGAADFVPLLFCWLVAQCAVCLFCLAAARRFLCSAREGSPTVWVELWANIKAGGPLLLAVLLGNLVPGAARLVVDGLFGIAAFGQFSFSLALVNMLGQCMAQVGMVLFPALKSRPKEQRARHYQLLDTVLYLLLPLPLLAYQPLCLLLSWWLPGYVHSLSLLAVLLPLCLFDARTQVLYSTVMKIHRQEKTLLLVNALGFCLSFGLCAVAGLATGRLEGVALALVAVSLVRCCLAGRKAAPWMGTRSKSYVAHLILSGIFILGNLFLSRYSAFILCAAACGVFWVANQGKFTRLAHGWRCVSWNG